MSEDDNIHISGPRRRKSLPFRPRPVTSYMPASEPIAIPGRHQSRMSFHASPSRENFEWSPAKDEHIPKHEENNDNVYTDPFSENTLSPLPEVHISHTRRHSSLAHSFMSGFSALGRRMSQTVRAGKGKLKDLSPESSKSPNILQKRRSQLFDFSESSTPRPRTRGLFNTLAGRRRPSMPLLNSYHGAPQLPGSFDPPKSLDDDEAQVSRHALLSPFVAGGHGARAAAAAQNEAMLYHRETPLPTDDAATSTSSDARDAESGIGISFNDEPQEPMSTPISRCDPTYYLATELLEQILSYLDVGSLINAELVSKKWATLSRSPVVWRDVFYRDYGLSTPGRLHSRPSTPGLGKNQPGQDYRKLYQVRKLIDKRWQNGEAAAIYLNGHKDSVYCVQFDEDKIITGSRDTTIRVWDSRTYQCLRKLGPPNNPRERGQPQRAEVEPTGAVPFFKCETSSPDPKTPPSLSMWHEASVLCLQYDDEILVTGSSDFSCIVWSIKDDYTPIFQLRGHTAGVLDVCIDPMRIITCSKDTTIKIWDRLTGQLLKTLRGHQGPVNAVQVRGNLLASASGDGLSKLWRLEDGICIKEFRSRERGLACVEFSEDGRTIFAGGNDRVIYEYNTVTGNIERELSGHKDLVRSLFLDSTNGRIVSGSYDHSIKVWDSKHGQDESDGGLKINLEGWTSSWMLAAKSNYRKIACASQDGRVVIVDFGYGIDGVHLVEA